ncbi:hypothetical protein AM305_12000 [Actinobacillus minor NM305]|uniref:Uncharacterized protein n=1 Tax=Actinobacillus minor NM305 TaxID=637911 RepID=C5S3E6_9PAST|nr:hypothetical protein [Actinobacillus minor]EER46606.1 hypothetical protein AM305_12000 [Actinobacillus minor NM305]
MAIARAIQQQNGRVAIYRDENRDPTIVTGVLVGYTTTEVLVREVKGNRVKVYNEKLQIVKITS